MNKVYCSRKAKVSHANDHRPSARYFQQFRPSLRPPKWAEATLFFLQIQGRRAAVTKTCHPQVRLPAPGPALPG
ncbi:hypothetical protein TNCT_669091 [Trichonephila clavata]|uniref:Uncharacterized protein n=1 Tax=Trichonephila clavata TaxID=2740835 RepID=A0A8X6FGZ2_TRICU|nr:hypothetical protein TNCT_669091 [Trichonephila clavata]